jgi:hypothetical protein
MRKLTRREALKAGALLLPALFAGCMRDGGNAAPARASAENDRALLDDIADTLLPDTAASPGAKTAGVGATIALMLADCEPLEVGRRVAEGLQAFRATCRERGGDFAALPAGEREALLRGLDAAAVAAREGHWFSDVRRLALDAYFSSEIGLTRAMRYVPIPGRYDGCVPLAPGQPAWG